MIENNLVFTCPNQKESWNHYRGVDNKTQLSPKIFPTSSHQLGGFHKKKSPSTSFIVVHLLP